MMQGFGVSQDQSNGCGDECLGNADPGTNGTRQAMHDGSVCRSQCVDNLTAIEEQKAESIIARRDDGEELAWTDDRQQHSSEEGTGESAGRVRVEAGYLMSDDPEGKWRPIRPTDEKRVGALGDRKRQSLEG